MAANEPLTETENAVAGAIYALRTRYPAEFVDTELEHLRQTIDRDGINYDTGMDADGRTWTRVEGARLAAGGWERALRAAQVSVTS